MRARFTDTNGAYIAGDFDTFYTAKANDGDTPYSVKATILNGYHTITVTVAVNLTEDQAKSIVDSLYEKGCYNANYS